MVVLVVGKKKKKLTAKAGDVGDKGSSSSILAWRIPWTEEAGWLQSIVSQKTGHDQNDSASVHADRYTEITVLSVISERQGERELRINLSPKESRRQCYMEDSAMMH